MFTPFKIDGGLQPWEYMPAKAGTYQGGQMLNASAGLLTPVSTVSTTTPGYLCMADITVAEGESIPVIRVRGNTIFETTLSAAAASAKIGSKLEVSAGGLAVDATAAGSFELTYVDGTAQGSMVMGRFV